GAERVGRRRVVGEARQHLRGRRGRVALDAELGGARDGERVGRGGAGADEVAVLAGERGGDEERAGDGAIGAAGGGLGQRAGGGAAGGVPVAARVVQARHVGEGGGEVGVPAASLGGDGRLDEERDRLVGLAAHLPHLGREEEIVEAGALRAEGRRL